MYPNGSSASLEEHEDPHPSSRPRPHFQFTSVSVRTQLYSCVCHFFKLSTFALLSSPARRDEESPLLVDLFSPRFIFTSLFVSLFRSYLNLIPANVTSWVSASLAPTPKALATSAPSTFRPLGEPIGRLVILILACLPDNKIRAGTALSAQRRSGKRNHFASKQSAAGAVPAHWGRGATHIQHLCGGGSSDLRPHTGCKCGPWWALCPCIQAKS